MNSIIGFIFHLFHIMKMAFGTPVDKKEKKKKIDIQYI